MKIYNTLLRKLEEIRSLEDKKIKMYLCGPTVYDLAHIGNLRTYILEDLLRRVLEVEGYEVNEVMNVTDIDDKTIARSGGKKEEFIRLTKANEEKFLSDEQELNIKGPNKLPRATEYIEKMVGFIEELLKKGYAYRGKDDSIYYSIEKFSGYGKLSRLDKSGIRAGARVLQDEYDKENPADFVLWKAWNEKDGEIYWETSLGKGRPGWHIECSTMSQDILGDTIDIHAGGVDLIFPHHENEIAQSEAKTGKKFVRYWVHSEHLLVDGRKMSKSLGNFYTLVDIKKKGFSPLDFRYFVLGAHYRSKLNFTWEALTSAKNARERLSRLVSEGKASEGQISHTYYDKFLKFLSNDLDSSNALAVLWEMMRTEKIDVNDRGATALKMDDVLAVGLGEIKEIDFPAKIKKLAEERREAREKGDYALSDKIRDQIGNAGYQIEDKLKNEYEISKK